MTIAPPKRRGGSDDDSPLAACPVAPVQWPPLQRPSARYQEALPAPGARCAMFLVARLRLRRAALFRQQPEARSSCPYRCGKRDTPAHWIRSENRREPTRANSRKPKKHRQGEVTAWLIAEIYRVNAKEGSGPGACGEGFAGRRIAHRLRFQRQRQRVIHGFQELEADAA